MAELASVELIDPEIGLVEPLGSLSEARVEHTATLLTDGRVLLAGGSAAGSALSRAELLDPLALTRVDGSSAWHFTHRGTLSMGSTPRRAVSLSTLTTPSRSTQAGSSLAA